MFQLLLLFPLFYVFLSLVFNILNCPYHKKLYYYVRSLRENAREKFRTTYQNYILIDGKIVFLDGPPRNPLFNMFTLDAGTVSTIIDVAEKNSFKKYDSNIEFQIKLNLIKNLLNPKYIMFKFNYKNYENYKKKMLNYEIVICPKTMRPFLKNPKTKKFWSVESEKLFGPLSKQIHIYTYFGNFICRYNKYPTKNEMIYYTYLKMQARGFSTLPKEIISIVDKLFVSFEKVLGPSFSNVPESSFRTIFKRSETVRERNNMEHEE